MKNWNLSGKTAILLSGNLRTWEDCKNSFNDIFSKDVDIFICASNVKYNYPLYIQENFTGFEDTSLTNEDILHSFEGLNLKEITIQNKDEESSYVLEESKKFKIVLDHTKINVNHTFSQFFKIKKCLSLMEKYENENGFKYDYVIKSRFDIIYNEFLPVDFATTILIDSGNCFPNDHFYMSNRNSIVNLINYMYNEFYEQKNSNSSVLPPHGILYSGIADTKLNIAKQKIVRCVLRKGHGPQYY